MKVETLYDIIGSDFYTGVPDSQLKALCNFLINRFGINPHHHIIAANEGNSTAIAAGYYLATGKVPVVYLQNSGEGNIINPVASLLNDKVYAIPVVFVIGWRGEPGTHDEPQHIYQGEVTTKLLDDMGIAYFIIGIETTYDEVAKAMANFRTILAGGKDVAFVIKKGALTDAPKVEYKNSSEMPREEIIKHIIDVSDTDPVICTTGKASRELFEIREVNDQPHGYDFLTVGSMGHSSSIALGVALNKPNTKVWCIDGDGSVLMHMGAMAVIGSSSQSNLVHIVINNGAHETVGGMPTVCAAIDLVRIAEACGYAIVSSVSSFDELDIELRKAKKSEMLTFIEVKCSIGAREDLGRPTTSAIENKQNFMEYLKHCR